MYILRFVAFPLEMNLNEIQRNTEFLPHVIKTNTEAKRDPFSLRGYMETLYCFTL